MEFDKFELIQNDLSYLDDLELQIIKENDNTEPHTRWGDVDMALPYFPDDFNSDSGSTDDYLQPVRNRRRHCILSETENEDEIILPSPRGSSSYSGNLYCPSGN